MKQRTWKKTAAFALALTLVAGAVPANTWTGGFFGETAIVAKADSAASYQAASWNETTKSVVYTTKTAESPTTLASDTTAWENGKWYIVSADTTISGRITVTGTVNLILADGATLTATRGITVSNGNTLNIYAQSEGDTAGKLVAGADSRSAAIGSARTDDYMASGNNNSGSINIFGGDLTVTGGSNAAAIGGAGDASYGPISIYGGTINATSGNNAGAAIGAGDSVYNSGGGTITIYGGTVNATGVGAAAGIGGGCSNGEAGTVTIYGGTVTAKAGNGGGFSYIPAGIGAASYRSVNESVNIYGGTVTAIGGTANAGGIGKNDRSGSKVGTITLGSNVKLSYSTDGVTYTEYDSNDYTNRPQYMKAEVTTIALTADNVTIADFPYDGKEHVAVLKYGDTVLTEGKDYELVSGSTFAATNAGTYTMMVNGKGDYTGENVKLTWKITQADLTLSPADDLAYKPNTAQNLIASDIPAGTQFTLTAPVAGADYDAEIEKISSLFQKVYQKVNSAADSDVEHFYDYSAEVLWLYLNIVEDLKSGNEEDVSSYLENISSLMTDIASFNVTPSDDVADAFEYINTYIKDTTLEKTKARFTTVEPDDWSPTAPTATDAGEYTIYYKGDGVNYNDTVKSVIAKIAKATPDAPTDLTGAASSPLADVELPEGWKWNDDQTTLPDMAGDYSFSASYTPLDENYEAVEGDVLTVTVTVDKTALKAAIDEAMKYAEEIAANPDYETPANDLKDRVSNIAERYYDNPDASQTNVTDATGLVNKAVEIAKEHVRQIAINKVIASHLTQ